MNSVQALNEELKSGVEITLRRKDYTELGWNRVCEELKLRNVMAAEYSFTSLDEITVLVTGINMIMLNPNYNPTVNLRSQDFNNVDSGRFDYRTTIN